MRNAIKSIVLIMLAAMMPLALPAQLAVGGWTIHSAFNGVEKIVETDTYAYCMSGGSLFRVDKDLSLIHI